MKRFFRLTDSYYVLPSSICGIFYKQKAIPEPEKPSWGVFASVRKIHNDVFIGAYFTEDEAKKCLESIIGDIEIFENCEKNKPEIFENNGEE